MPDPSNDLAQRATAYATARLMQLKHQLGGGKDGIVFSTSVATAVKVFLRPDAFSRERDCYLRLAESDVREVLGHHIPQLLHFDPNLLVIEMTIVQPPFLLDFASAYLDWPPEFSPEALNEWREAKAEEFGAHWGRVLLVLDLLREHFDIYLTDVHPGNITFDDVP